MRVGIALVMAAVLMMAPTASAHGANTFAFIMRNNSVQPDEASVQQNDTLIFYNVASDRNLTLTFSAEGKNGTIDWDCETGPSNSTNTDDECLVWLDPSVYNDTMLRIHIFENDTLWNKINVTIQFDNHTENGPPTGFIHPGDGHQPSDKAELAIGEFMQLLFSPQFLLILLLMVILGFIRTRRLKNEEE